MCPGLLVERIPPRGESPRPDQVGGRWNTRGHRDRARRPASKMRLQNGCSICMINAHESYSTSSSSSLGWGVREGPVRTPSNDRGSTAPPASERLTSLGG